MTAAFGATFVGMQAFEWTKLITEGVRPWGNPWGAAQFGATFFMITGFHGTHVTIGVIFLIIIALKVCAATSTSAGPGSSPADGAATRSSRSWASTGTSSTSSGSSSSRSSISGEERMADTTVQAWPTRTQALTPRRPARGGPAASAEAYLVVWGWLFVLSTCSYLVDYFGLQGELRWTLILIFMMLKAGLIVAVFMHMGWERLALVYAILLPMSRSSSSSPSWSPNPATRSSPGRRSSRYSNSLPQPAVGPRRREWHTGCA